VTIIIIQSAVEVYTDFITGPPNGPVLFCTLSSVVVCNAAGVRAGRPPGAWTVGAAATGRVGGPAADNARRASVVTSRYGDTLFFDICEASVAECGNVNYGDEVIYPQWVLGRQRRYELNQNLLEKKVTMQ